MRQNPLEHRGSALASKNLNSRAGAAVRQLLWSAGRTALMLVALTLAIGAVSANAAGAAVRQDTPTTEQPAQPESTTTIELSNEKETESLGSSLPGIDSGHKPKYQGDRGTWPQYALMVGMVIVLASFVMFFRRDMRKARSAKTVTPESASAPR